MEKDPYNVIVCGVGGQGNVLASQLIGAVLVEQGNKVTIGETYGASQRGGSVMSHVRISKTKQFGPLMPPGSADLVIALEPMEAARILAGFGNPRTRCVVNTRQVQPVDVISGELEYPDTDLLMERVESLSSRAYFVPATEGALDLGNPILSNIILLGAAAEARLLPIELEALEKAIADYMSEDKVPINRKAFELGRKMMSEL